MKLAVIGIIINGDRKVAEDVNKILSSFGDYVVCRMGVPDRVNNIYVISIIARAELEVISALCGKLGRLENVTVKSAISNVDTN